MTSDDILDGIVKRHTEAWIFLPELRMGTGYGYSSEQRVDAWAIHPWPSKGLSAVAYEIKVSRKDWLNELKKPLKRRGALLHSNLFYFATPAGLIKDGELPIETGLIEVTDGRAKEVVPAPRRDIGPPTWLFVAALMRRLGGGKAMAHWGTWTCVCGSRVRHNYDNKTTVCENCGRTLSGKIELPVSDEFKGLGL